MVFATKLFGVQKKGQMALLDILSAVFVFFIPALILFLVLSMTGCFINNNKAKAAIGSDISLAQFVKADAQLDSYLSTQMPDKADMHSKLELLRSLPTGGTANLDLADKLGVNIGKVESFLDSHPELYAKKDYSEFISGLHAIYASGKRGDAENAFKAVTAAMFLRDLKDYPKKGQYLFYLLPIGVEFVPKDFAPSSAADMCDTYGNLCVKHLPTEIVPLTLDPSGSGNRIPVTKTASWSVQAIPLADGTFAKIEFRYYPELPSTLPKA